MAKDTLTSEAEDVVSIEDVDPKLQPLMEATSEWFERVPEQYYMSTGGMGTLTALSPYGATFSWVNNGGELKFYPTRLHSFESCIPEEKEEEVNVVSPPTNAREAHNEYHTTTTWKKELDSQLYIFEYVPFKSPPVTSPEALKPELCNIMETTPDFEELFSESKKVAQEDNTA